MNKAFTAAAALGLTAALTTGLAGCDRDTQPQQHIYRYPAGVAPAVTLLDARPGTRVDHHNHALAEPGDGQHWQLRSGAFVLVNTDNTVAASVPATYLGR